MTTLNLHTSRFVRRAIVLLLICSVGVSVLHAAKDSLVVRNDSITMLLREPDAATQQKIYTDKEWRYETEEPKKSGEKSFFDRLLDEILKGLFDDMSESSSDPKEGGKINWWTIFFILVGAALLVFFILKATGSGGNLLFKGKSKRKEQVDAMLEEVDIHAIDYATEIQSAKLRRDYRFATRLWFLRSLKDMADLDLIIWKIDKTNSDYYYELSGSDLRKEFGEVSLLYDYIWYGDFEIDEAKYNDVESDLSKFHLNVKKSAEKK